MILFFPPTQRPKQVRPPSAACGFADRQIPPAESHAARVAPRGYLRAPLARRGTCIAPVALPGNSRTPLALRNNRRCRRGIIFVAAMGVIIILGALLLVFARSMRTEALASANRLAEQQASTIELGAEQYVMAAVDGCNGDAVSVLQTPAEQIQLGGGYFWMLQPDPDDNTDYAFGLVDEGSKENISYATDAELAALPGMTQDVADSIVDWRDADETVTGQGAESSSYQNLPRPYTAKNSPFESIEELFLVKPAGAMSPVSDTILYGYDLNHNGVIDQSERDAGGDATTFNSGNNDASRGIYPFVTAWGKEPNVDANGKARLNIKTAVNPTTLAKVLTNAGISQARARQIIARATIGRAFQNVFDFALKSGMKSAELDQVADYLTTSTAKTLNGLVNVNTAPSQVLLCLPGLTQQDADAIVSHRGSGSGSGLGSGGSGLGSNSSSTTGIGWVMDTLTPAKAAAIGARITGKSFFYSADIVAVTGEGRGFRRVRIVIDARSSPPIIVYRKDLTNLGWPLQPMIRTALRSGKPPQPTGSGTGHTNALPQ